METANDCAARFPQTAHQIELRLRINQEMPRVLLCKICGFMDGRHAPSIRHRHPLDQTATFRRIGTRRGTEHLCGQFIAENQRAFRHGLAAMAIRPTTRPEAASITTSSSPLGPESRSKIRLPSNWVDSMCSPGAITVAT